MEKESEVDTPKCDVCKSRTALITGYFSYKPDAEPYKNGKKEKSKAEGGFCSISGYKCDKCGHIQLLSED